MIRTLVLDLDGDGVQLTSVSEGTSFDLLASGSRVRTAWISGGDALLAMDRNGNGRIDDGSELFGNATAGGSFPDGFAALAALDENGDGRIDASDSAFDSLLLWRDLNHDGRSTPDELSTLADFGIVEIDLHAQSLQGRAAWDGHGNSMPLRSTFGRANGTRGLLVDAFLRFEPARRGALDPLPACVPTEE